MTFLMLGSFALGLLGVFRMVQALSQWNWLVELEIFPNPVYFILTGFVWAAANLTGAGSILLRASWSPVYTRINALLFCSWYWLEYLFLMQSSTRTTNVIFLITLSLLWISVSVVVFYHPKMKAYFSKETPDTGVFSIIRGKKTSEVFRGKV